MEMRVALLDTGPLSSYSAELVKAIVTDITLHADKSVTLTLKNGQQVRKEQSDGMNTATKRVRTIPATVQPLNVYSTEYLLKRVAAYCRVSTKQEEQLNSYETQVRYYTDRINREPGWKLAGIYADEAVIIGLKTLRLKKC